MTSTQFSKKSSSRLRPQACSVQTENTQPPYSSTGRRCRRPNFRLTRLRIAVAVAAAKKNLGTERGLKMAFRGKEMMKKALKKLGHNSLAPGLEKSLQNSLPDSKVVMGRAKRGLFAGRHIQFGNRVSEDGGNKTRRTWKPNVQEKRLFSYILDRHIRVKITTHALRCIDKAGGIDEYLLKTPYQKMDTEMGVVWKAKIEKLYEEFGNVQTTEGEASPEQGLKDLTLAKQDHRRQFRRQIFSGFDKQKQTEGGSQEASDENASSRIPVSYVICPDDLKENSIIVNY